LKKRIEDGNINKKLNKFQYKLINPKKLKSKLPLIDQRILSNTISYLKNHWMNSKYMDNLKISQLQQIQSK
jgi:hypothetical protein